MELEKIEQSNESTTKEEKENIEQDEKFPTTEEINNGEAECSISRYSTDINDSLTSENVLKNSLWEIGQLAWARMSIYPFWPCMITFDPNSLMAFQKVQTIGKSKTHMIHVHFFNDNGRHSWIPSHHMIPFYGIEDFRKRANLVTDVIRKKEPKFAAALSVKPNIFGTWQKAVAEAMDVLYELDMTALNNFKPQLKDLTNNISKSNSVNRKRKRKEEDSKNKKKFFKQTDSNSELKVSTNTNNLEEEDKLNLETPPISPQNDEDLRATIIQKQKRITKMINKLQPPDFEVYFERNLLTIKEQHSDATDEQVRTYLYDVWENMALEDKLKYRATYRIEGDS